jgi:hypothetical protein
MQDFPNPPHDALSNFIQHAGAGVMRRGADKVARIPVKI